MAVIRPKKYPPLQSDMEINRLLQSVGCDKFEILERFQLRKTHKDVQLDFSSITKVWLWTISINF